MSAITRGRREIRTGMTIRIGAAATTTAAARIGTRNENGIRRESAKKKGTGIARAAPRPLRRATTSPILRAAKRRSITAAIGTERGREIGIGRR